MPTSLSARSVIPLGRTSGEAFAWRFKGELRVSAVVKATFAFASDGAALRIDPLPILREDAHHARNPMRSLIAASDLVPYRRRADILFTGHAHAPAGSKPESAAVRLGVASGARVLLDKVLYVRKRGGFARIPLLYEHTAGGMGSVDNPYGEDAGSEEHNVYHPSDTQRAAGFGPISAAMTPRQRHLGSAKPPAFGQGIVEIPDTFDFDFFQSAPADQQIAFLRGDEWLLLEGLHAAHPRLRMYLPAARGLARIHGLEKHGVAEGQPLAMSADMLHVNGEDERISVTWRGTFALKSEAALPLLRIVAGVEQYDEPVIWPDPGEIAQLGVESAPLSRDVVITSAPESDKTMALPDGSAGETLPIPSTVARAGSPAPLPFRAPSIGERLAGASIQRSAPASASASRGAPRSRRGGVDETLPIASERAKAPWPDALPFAPVGAATLPVETSRERSERTSEPGQTIESSNAPAEPAAPQAAAPAEAEKKKGSPWAPAPEAPPAEAPKAQEKLPPKVDVNNKLYGAKKPKR